MSLDFIQVTSRPKSTSVNKLADIPEAETELLSHDRPLQLSTARDSSTPYPQTSFAWIHCSVHSLNSWKLDFPVHSRYTTRQYSFPIHSRLHPSL